MKSRKCCKSQVYINRTLEENPAARYQHFGLWVPFRVMADASLALAQAMPRAAPQAGRAPVRRLPSRPQDAETQSDRGTCQSRAETSGRSSGDTRSRLRGGLGPSPPLTDQSRCQAGQSFNCTSNSGQRTSDSGDSTSDSDDGRGFRSGSDINEGLKVDHGRALNFWARLNDTLNLTFPSTSGTKKAIEDVRSHRRIACASFIGLAVRPPAGMDAAGSPRARPGNLAAFPIPCARGEDRASRAPCAPCRGWRQRRTAPRDVPAGSVPGATGTGCIGGEPRRRDTRRWSGGNAFAPLVKNKARTNINPVRTVKPCILQPRCKMARDPGCKQGAFLGVKNTNYGAFNSPRPFEKKSNG